MNEGLKALENIKIDMEYVTRLDFVEPIVRGEVQQNLYKIYHRETPELDIIEKELKDYQEIREIAKRYNWDDIISEIFNVEMDKKYRHLFSSAIVDIQEDYRKARAFEIVKNKGVFVHLLQQSRNVKEYNSLMIIAFKKMAEKDYKGVVEKFCLTQEDFDFLKKALL